MLSRPHVLLSRALVSLELLSRRFRDGASHSMQAFAGLSRRDLLWLLSSFRGLRFGFRGDSIGHPPLLITLYCQGFWRCSNDSCKTAV